MFLTLNPYDNIIRIYETESEALKDSVKLNSVKLNQEDINHPSFLLYEIRLKKVYLLGSLHRDFGKKELYWEKFK